jgi:pimeloyl-ACP methyl ester carboxylesterase
MAEYLLVHGAWHGAWCWDKVISGLQQGGDRARAIDLPGHGDDATPLPDVTLDAYAARIVAALQESEAPVILVGHSMGGMAISAAAEAAPERLQALVYVAAFMPRDGESLLDLERRNPNVSVPTHLVVAPDGVSGTLPADKHRMLFYHDCSDADGAAASARLKPQALAPLGTPVRLTPERFGRVPRVYVECTEDGAISIDLQRDMIAASPPAAVYTLKASHSPFLSMPEELAAVLAEVRSVR